MNRFMIKSLKIDGSGKHRKSIDILAVLSVVFSILVLIFAQSKFLPTRQLKTFSLQAEALEGESVPQVVWLASAKIDNAEVAFWDVSNAQTDGWEYISEHDDYKILLFGDSQNSFSFDAYCESVTLDFVSGEGCGAVTISDGETTRCVDLSEESSVTIDVRGSYSIFERIAKNTVFFCFLFFAFYLLFVIISQIGSPDSTSADYLWFCVLWGMLVIWRTGLLPRAFLPHLIYTDTRSYWHYPWGDLFRGSVTSGRTPVYPAFLKICELMFGETKQFYAVVQIQLIVSLLGVIPLYDLLVRITHRQKLSALLCFAYGMNLDIAVWDYAILTESLALTMTIVFINLIVRYIQAPAYATGVKVILLSLVMTFLRPTFLLFTAVLLGVWILRLFLFSQERNILMRLSCVSLAAFVVIGLYAVSFQKHFGYYSISDAMPRQNIVSCIRRGYYQESENPEFVSIIEEHYDPVTNGWNAKKPLFDAFGEKEANRLAKQTLYADIPRYMKDTIVWMGYDLSSPFANAYVESTRSWANNSDTIQLIISIAHSFQFSVGLLYFILLGQIVLFVIKFIRERALPWIDFGLWGFLLVIPISTYVATCAEFPRTMIHVLPFLYCSAASLLTEAATERTNSKLFTEKAEKQDNNHENI